MTQSFRRIATVEFAIQGTNTRVTISDLPYIWMPAVTGCMDQEGVFAAMDFMRSNWGGVNTRGLTVVSVVTSPAKEDAA